ncbi:MAG: hypothetical protein JW822_02550 [Spirochaetales bacterium]|nr:hypothetical protein [Spirochaetales bacterium]
MKKWFVIYMFIMLACLTVGTSCNSLNVSVEHKISLKNAGTINELSMGHLYINNNELPPFFELVIIENQIYQFVLRENAGRAYGYWPEDEFQLPPINIVEEIDEQEIERGWYFSDLDRKKALTPGDWIWIKSGDIRAYVDAGKLPNFVQTQKANLINLEKS